MKHNHCFSQTNPASAQPHRAPKGYAGLTLIEILVSITLVAILSGVVVATVGTGRKHAEMVSEVSSMRSLISAYLMTPNDNDGLLLRAEQSGGDYTNRWSYKMTSYLGDTFRNTLYINDQLPAYDSFPTDEYKLSLFCSFGINHRFVGGNFNYFGRPLDSGYVISLADAQQPGGLIVFTSSEGYDAGFGMKREIRDAIGYYKINSPTSGEWKLADVPENNKSSSPVTGYGKVSFRHKGKAVVAFLDGSVKTMGSAEMRDMRLWSNEARIQNNSDYIPPRAE